MRRRRKPVPVSIIRLEPAEVAMMYSGKLNFPVIAMAGMERDKTFVGMGGLAWISGRCWLWLDHVDMNKRHAVTVVRMARRMLKKAVQLGEAEVWARREKDVAPLSTELLTLLGFEKVTDEDDIEDWKWQHSPQSQSVSP